MCQSAYKVPDSETVSEFRGGIADLCTLDFCNLNENVLLYIYASCNSIFF